MTSKVHVYRHAAARWKKTGKFSKAQHKCGARQPKRHGTWYPQWYPRKMLRFIMLLGALLACTRLIFKIKNQAKTPQNRGIVACLLPVIDTLTSCLCCSLTSCWLNSELSSLNWSINPANSINIQTMSWFQRVLVPFVSFWQWHESLLTVNEDVGLCDIV